MDSVEKGKLWAELDTLGEHKVRENLGLGLYGDRRKNYVAEWLRQKEQAPATPWHRTWWGKAAIAIAIIVLGAFLVSLLRL